MARTGSPQMLLSSRDGGCRLDVVAPPAPVGGTPTEIALDESVLYQRIEGFGGSFTEASAIALSRLTSDKRDEILRAYFDPVDGHGYTLARTHINSCDFSSGDWDYVEAWDVGLGTFSVSSQEARLFPLIRDAQKIAGAPIQLVASPWSPPAWMKTNGDMKHGGRLKSVHYGAWANYFVRYINACRRAGLQIWGVTVQNEPQAIQVWESCIYSPQEQLVFVRDHLGPALQDAGMSDVRLMIWDHNKDGLVDFCTPILTDPKAASFVWGAAFHWYSGDDFDALTAFHDAFPEKHLLFTEGCMENGVELGSWESAERYGHDIIGDLERWTVGWIDWNLVLDETGGPNHVGNLCDAAVIADGTTNTVHYQPSFWVLGHFSRFIKPGARRIGCAAIETRAMETTAFLNPDASVVLVVLNRSDEPEDLTCRVHSQTLQTSSPPHSIMTVVWR
jgi:glucosylceramidase